MIVTVPAVGMMQVPADEVILVIPVGDRLVATPGAVLVRGVVLRTAV